MPAPDRANDTQPATAEASTWAPDGRPAGLSGPVLRLTVPAKVNLALHVLGRREDGYHELQSLVAFAAVADGDVVTVGFGAPGPDGPRFEVSGHFGHEVPDGPHNLAHAAARLCPEIGYVGLVKGLPVAAGIGGGSADAAAVLRAAAIVRGIDPRDLAAAGLSLGADVPVCLDGRPSIMAGIGDRVTPVALPALHGLLVNPGLPLSTAAVFSRLERRDNAPFAMPEIADAAALCDWLRTTRNDLEGPARAACPEIDVALDAVERREGCLLARMSGSGPTVFGLFRDAASRDAAMSQVARRGGPRWWVRAAQFAASAEGPAGAEVLRNPSGAER